MEYNTNSNPLVEYYSGKKIANPINYNMDPNTIIFFFIPSLCIN